MVYQDAEKMFTSFKTLTTSCHSLLADFDDADVMDDIDELRGLVAHFMGNTYYEVLRPLHNQFAQLDPMSTDSKYLPATETSQAFDGARLFDNFFDMAQRAVNEHAPAIRAGEASGYFRAGSTQEVVDAIAAIERFAAKKCRRSFNSLSPPASPV
jgi:hypothetical protein